MKALPESFQKEIKNFLKQLATDFPILGFLMSLFF
jgi:hypothetical protein